MGFQFWIQLLRLRRRLLHTVSLRVRRILLSLLSLRLLPQRLLQVQLCLKSVSPGRSILRRYTRCERWWTRRDDEPQRLCRSAGCQHRSRRIQFPDGCATESHRHSRIARLHAVDGQPALHIPTEKRFGARQLEVGKRQVWSCSPGMGWSARCSANGSPTRNTSNKARRSRNTAGGSIDTEEQWRWT